MEILKLGLFQRLANRRKSKPITLYWARQNQLEYRSYGIRRLSRIFSSGQLAGFRQFWKPGFWPVNRLNTHICRKSSIVKQFRRPSQQSQYAIFSAIFRRKKPERISFGLGRFQFRAFLHSTVFNTDFALFAGIGCSVVAIASVQ